MAKKFYGNYEGVDERRKQEVMDSDMLGSGGFANMPSEVVMREYPKVHSGMPEGLDDTIKGIDKQIRDDSKRKKPINSEKY